MPQKSVETCNLPRNSLACCVRFNIFLVGRAAAGGGQLLLGGIQLATDVAMLPSFPQQQRGGRCWGAAPRGGMVLWRYIWQTTWSCHPLGVGGFIGWLFFGLGIAESRPGKSGQRGGGVLLANFFNVGLDFIVLCLGKGARPHVTSLVVAVDKAFGTDVPAGAHEGGFIPLGTILCAFPCKIMLPNLALFHQEFGDEGRVFDDVLPFNLIGLPLFSSLSFAIIPGHDCGWVC
jgi:hypothetical protein